MWVLVACQRAGAHLALERVAQRFVRALRLGDADDRRAACRAAAVGLQAGAQGAQPIGAAAHGRWHLGMSSAGCCYGSQLLLQACLDIDGARFLFATK